MPNNEKYFKQVWYRPAIKPAGTLLAYCHSGTLAISDKSLRFAGKGFQIQFDTIDDVSYTGASGDFINNWVHVRSGDQLACFADGGWMGFRGHIASGTKRIYDAIRSSLNNSAQQVVDEQPPLAPLS